MTDRIDMPEIKTIKIKRPIVVKGIRCIVCGAWECPECDKDEYIAEIIGETTGLCKSCKKAIKWAKEQMEGWRSGNERQKNGY